MTTDRNRWDDARAADLDEPARLLYRSNLLGADKTVTNFGGGNTSAKVRMPDPLTGEPVDVLWVKGSGGDLGSMSLDGFATLYLDKLQQLKGLYRGIEHEDEMVGYLPHCTFDLNPRAASIDTPLHAFIPHAHVDHMHPDAVIAIAATAESEALTAEIFDGALGWLPWQRPGFDLGLKLGELAEARPALRGVVLAGHGLFTWADSARACYETTLWAISKAEQALSRHAEVPAFGGAASAPLSADARRRVITSLMPEIRRRIAGDTGKIGHVEAGPETLTFVSSRELESLAALGTSCPDHFLRTKIRPMIVPIDGDAVDVTALEHGLERYRADYGAYYARCAGPDSPPMRDPNPVIFLVPRVGLLSFARDKATARIASEFYVNAINVMREANRVGRYVGLDEQEAFDIEYWQLEEAKLQRMPTPKPMAGRVALVTGAGGGIGQAIVERLLREDACVVMTDIDEAGLAEAGTGLAARHSADRVRTARMDVTDEASVRAAFDVALREFGGVDVFVANAGIASSAPLTETSEALWQQNFDILAKGYFLPGREALREMQRGGGGSIVFVGSKNGLVASSGAAAYAAAKAAELHLARCMALEGAPHGIRVNSVNPDAVLNGSKIWSSEWRRSRAQTYGIAEDELEAFYRDRSLLKREVLPEDIAEAVYFFASSLAAKSTGNILNVDAGNAGAFTR